MRPSHNRQSREQMNQLIANYRTLRDWCDRFFESVNNQYGSDMQCQKGCAECCTLTSVTKLEGEVIKRYLQQERLDITIEDPSGCPFLNSGACTIYPVRPIICRTHGLLLFNKEENRLTPSCVLNFKSIDLKQFNNAHALDTSTITDNLMRFNLLYCMIQGQENDDGRMLLRNLIDE